MISITVIRVEVQLKCMLSEVEAVFVYSFLLPCLV